MFEKPCILFVFDRKMDNAYAFGNGGVVVQDPLDFCHFFDYLIPRAGAIAQAQGFKDVLLTEICECTICKGQIVEVFSPYWNLCEMVDNVGEEIIRETRERRGQHGGKLEG